MFCKKKKDKDRKREKLHTPLNHPNIADCNKNERNSGSCSQMMTTCKSAI